MKIRENDMFKNLKLVSYRKSDLIFMVMIVGLCFGIAWLVYALTGKCESGATYGVSVVLIAGYAMFAMSAGFSNNMNIALSMSCTRKRFLKIDYIVCFLICALSVFMIKFLCAAECAIFAVTMDPEDKALIGTIPCLAYAFALTAISELASAVITKLGKKGFAIFWVGWMLFFTAVPVIMDRNETSIGKAMTDLISSGRLETVVCAITFIISAAVIFISRHMMDRQQVR